MNLLKFFNCAKVVLLLSLRCIFMVHSIAKRDHLTRHFFNGEWNTGGSCDNIVPMAYGSEVWQDKSDDSVVESAVRGTRVKLLDITALSQLRDGDHISRYGASYSERSKGVQDCLHWCLPGIPDAWNELLATQIYRVRMEILYGLNIQSLFVPKVVFTSRWFMGKLSHSAMPQVMVNHDVIRSMGLDDSFKFSG
ncbi:PC-Esterase [Dillenia turbinata]|uniref:PC-Esterase n=1 Tax=Dillenia turbinata TaxID=194707 RepID=A0AAN8UYK0_9MAGN